MSTAHFAQTTDFSFVEELLSYNEDNYSYSDDDEEDEGEDSDSAERAAQEESSEEEDEAQAAPYAGAHAGADEGAGQGPEAPSWYHGSESAAIAPTFERYLRRRDPDGVAFADGLVDSALVERLRKDVQRLIEVEPVDYHPGSGTKVRDLVHPSLFPYVEGRSVLKTPVPPREAPSYDRFGRPFESSRYQWLPTPFGIAEDGSVTIKSYINNLDRKRHAAAYQNLASLFATALPLIESVVGYVETTKFWQDDCEDIEHEGELPESRKQARRAAPPKSLRGRELLVIPKIVEYRLGAEESHEGVWHVEGMSHEHIIATCVYVLHRDEALVGGVLGFKRAYTVEEAGRLFWNIDQCREAEVDEMVNEGTIPIGSVATPAGRLLVFPNSHIHKLSKLSVAAGAKEGRRQVIVFWLVDPNVTIPSTREVAEQQGLIPQEEALAIRLELMDERRRHKQSLNVRAVSLCEH